MKNWVHVHIQMYRLFWRRGQIMSLASSGITIVSGSAFCDAVCMLPVFWRPTLRPPSRWLSVAVERYTPQPPAARQINTSMQSNTHTSQDTHKHSHNHWKILRQRPLPPLSKQQLLHQQTLTMATHHLPLLPPGHCKTIRQGGNAWSNLPPPPVSLF